MFCEFGAGMYSAFFVIGMQSGHVDSTYWLLEEQKSF
jgi:hypothetical protein